VVEGDRRSLARAIYAGRVYPRDTRAEAEALLPESCRARGVQWRVGISGGALSGIDVPSKRSGRTSSSTTTASRCSHSTLEHARVGSILAARRGNEQLTHLTLAFVSAVARPRAPRLCRPRTR